jgi:hypothetical protein
MSSSTEVLAQLLKTLSDISEMNTLLLQKLNARIDLLEKRVSELQTAGGPCYRCGRTGHWASTCYARNDVYGNDLESDSSGYNSE